MREWRSILLLAVLAIAFYWKLTLSRAYTFLDSPDLAYMTLPWYELEARAFHRGVFPFWDPYQWCGQPIIGQMQPGAAFPLNWPLFLAPLREGRLNLDVLHWHFTLMHWLAAVFMYLYCRELGKGQFASLLAGCAFSFGGFVGLTNWPQVTNGALWLPLIFLFYHRAARAPAGIRATANAAGCGISIGLALLAGHHQAPMLEVFTLAAVFLFHFLTSRDRWRRLRLFGVTAVFAFLAGALLLLPAWEFGTRSYRWVNLAEPVRLNQTVSYLAQQGLALRPIELLGLIAPLEEGTAAPFVGLVSLALALFAVVVCWQKPAVRLHACVALGGLAYALGPYSVLQGVLYALVPFLNRGRTPSYGVLVFQFGLLVVAAHGADALFVPSAWQRRFVRALLAAGGLMAIAPLLLTLGANPAPSRAHSLGVAAVAALLLAVLAYAGAKRRWAWKPLQAGVLLLLLFELYAGNWSLVLPRTNPQTPTRLEQLAQHQGVFNFLKAQKRPFRFHADDQEIPFNAGDWLELDDTAGYVAQVNAALYDFIALDWTRTALMLNQVYVVAREKTRPEQVEVFSEPGGLKVFRNTDAYPRAWLVRAVREVATLGEAGLLLSAPGFDPRREAFLLASRPPPLEPCEGEGAAEVVAQEMHRVRVRVRTACRAMLVLGDPIFPGWRARVDGAPAPMYAAYGALRGVVVPPGEHVVETEYAPRSVYLGGVLSAVGLASGAILALAARRGSRATGP